MKMIFILLISFLLIGCGNEKLEIIEMDRNHYSNSFDSVGIGITEKGLYYINNENLFYKANDDSIISLGPVNYVDGKKLDMENNSFDSNIRIDLFSGRDLICYGNRIYMEYHTIYHDMTEVYQLASVDLKGEDFKVHIKFDFVPQRIIINNGKIYVAYLDYDLNQSYIEIYNQNYNLIDTIYYGINDNILNFYIENDEIVVPKNLVIYENKDLKLSYKIENRDSNDNRKMIGSIRIGEKVFSFENKLVLFVNDNYFYTSSYDYPQTFERYHLSGELDKSIIINEHIKTQKEIINSSERDFSYIVKLKNEDVGYGHSNHRIFEVNFEEGTCNYVDE